MIRCQLEGRSSTGRCDLAVMPPRTVFADRPDRARGTIRSLAEKDHFPAQRFMAFYFEQIQVDPASDVLPRHVLAIPHDSVDALWLVSIRQGSDSLADEVVDGEPCHTRGREAVLDGR